MTARVSVIIPCYNYGHYLAGCVQSVLDQPGVAVSILIIDDASTDDSAAVAATIAGSDERIDLIAHQRNRGHIQTYNEGIEWANGDYLVLLSADDMLTPGALSRAAGVLQAHPDVGFAYGRHIPFGADGTLPLAHTAPVRWQIWQGHEWLETRCRLGRVQIASPEVVVRTALQHRLGGYLESLPHSGDAEMWMRFARHADVAFIDCDQAYYRVHQSSMSKTRFASLLIDAEQRKAAFDTALEPGADFGLEPGADSGLDSADLHRLAMRGLAGDCLWQACRAYDRHRLDVVPADGLAEFAERIFPQASTLREDRGLRLRRRLGPRLSRALEPLRVPAVAGRRIRQRRWEYGRFWLGHLR